MIATVALVALACCLFAIPPHLFGKFVGWAFERLIKTRDKRHGRNGAP